MGITLREREYKVVFQPSGRHVYALAGTVLLEAAARAGLVLRNPCGGGGTCGKCKVRVVAGVCPPTAACRAVLGERAVAAGMRLACQARLQDEIVLEIPDDTLFDPCRQILAGGSVEGVDVRPAVAGIFVEIPPPSHDDARSDEMRLCECLPQPGFSSVDNDLLRRLPGCLREAGFKGTAVVVDDELVEFLPGESNAACYGVAFDIGTTTLAGTLVNLADGRDLAVCTDGNPQAAMGDDVVSRIRHCRDEPGGLERLRAIMVGALNRMLDQLAVGAGVERTAIFEVVMAGNTAMQQIACGIDPGALGELPFTPAFSRGLRLKAADIGLKIHPAGRVYVLPQIGGFVGGDSVAGIIAARLEQQPGPVLLVDIGTNGEIVLAHDGRLSATSVAAGPAFEGARISRGMRAVGGAVEKVLINDDLHLNVIENRPPAGLCGSGLIDLAAEMLRVGVLDETGRILDVEEWPAHVPEALRRRLQPGAAGNDFVLAFAEDAADGEPVLFTQRDARELQLATAAVRAGIVLLLRMHDLQPMDLKAVFLAGGFGNFIRRNHAQRIGLLPGIPVERIRFVGNTAAMGAKMTLLSMREKQYAEETGRRTRHVDLSLLPEFQEEFSAAMVFPAQCSDQELEI